MLPRRIARVPGAIETAFSACDWRSMDQGLGSGQTTDGVSALAADDLGVVVAGFSAGQASRSVDEGVNWSPLITDLNSGGTNQSLNALATDDAGIWVAGFNEGWASRSVDNGAIWGALPRWLNSGASLATEHLTALATDGAGTWVAGFVGGWTAVSTDDGASWIAGIRGLNCGNSTADVISIVCNRNDVWIAVFADGYVSRSSDNASSWFALPRGLGLTTNNIISLATDGAGVWIALAELENSVAKSINDGSAWIVIPVSILSSFTKIATNQTGLWYTLNLTGYGYFSRNNGSDWFLLPQGFHSNVPFPPVYSDGTALAFGGDKFYAGFVDARAARWGKDLL